MISLFPHTQMLKKHIWSESHIFDIFAEDEDVVGKLNKETNVRDEDLNLGNKV